MSRAAPRIFDRPGPTPGQIVTRGVNVGSEALGRGFIDLEQRQLDMSRKTSGAEWQNKDVVDFTQAGLDASEGPIDAMPGVIEKLRESRLAEAEQEQDPILRANKIRITEQISARATNNMLRVQVSREVGRAVRVSEEKGRTWMDAIAAGNATAGEAIDDIVEFNNSQKENVFGEDIDKVNRSMAGDIIEEQLNVLMKQSPKLAVEFTNGETVKKWLTTKQIDAMKSQIEQNVTSSLINIEGRAVAISNSNFPDKVEQLEDLRDELLAQPEVARTKLTAKELDARISNAKKSQVTKADRVALGFAVINGTSDKLMPNEQRTLNEMYQQVKSDPAQLQVLLQGVMREGVDFPLNYVDDLKRDGSQGTLNLARGIGQLRQIAANSIDRAARLASDAGPVMKAAFGATIRVESSADMQERLDVLSSPDAPGLLAAADEALGDDILDDVAKSSGVGFVAAAFVISPLAGVLAATGVIGRSAPRMGPEEKSELRDSYSYHWVKARRDLATDDPTVLKNAALRNATIEWEKNHTAVKITTGRNHFRYVPNNAIMFDKSFPIEQATKSITRDANRLLKTAGPDAGFLSANPITDFASRKSWFAVTNVDGVHGFVEWDAESGKTKTIKSGDEFDRLRTQMSVRRLSPVPNTDLARQPGQTEMTDQQQNDFIDMGVSEFFKQNGRMPSVSDGPAVDAITAMLEQSKGWD